MTLELMNTSTDKRYLSKSTSVVKKVNCKIKEGTQSGTKIRLKGKGVVSMKNPKVHGDQYVTVQIQVPKNLNEEAKKKLKEFEKACGSGYRSVA